MNVCCRVLDVHCVFHYLYIHMSTFVGLEQVWVALFGSSGRGDLASIKLSHNIFSLFQINVYVDVFAIIIAMCPYKN